MSTRDSTRDLSAAHDRPEPVRRAKPISGMHVSPLRIRARAVTKGILARALEETGVTKEQCAASLGVSDATFGGAINRGRQNNLHVADLIALHEGGHQAAVAVMVSDLKRLIEGTARRSGLDPLEHVRTIISGVAQIADVAGRDNEQYRARVRAHLRHVEAALLDTTPVDEVP